jgi:hypothetical protein
MSRATPGRFLVKRSFSKNISNRVVAQFENQAADPQK